LLVRLDANLFHKENLARLLMLGYFEIHQEIDLLLGFEYHFALFALDYAYKEASRYKLHIALRNVINFI